MELGFIDLYFDKHNIINAESIPPTNAHITTTTGLYMVTALAEDVVPCMPAPKHIMPTVAPNEAPCEIPSVDDDASGFLKTLCITLPAIARSIPATIAVAILGSLMLNTIDSDILSPFPKRQFIT